MKFKKDYRPFTGDIDIDCFCSVDTSDTVKLVLTTIDCDENPKNLGFFDGDVEHVKASIKNLTTKEKKEFDGLKILFIRTSSILRNNNDSQKFLHDCLDVFLTLKTTFKKSKIYFLMAVNIPFKPMTPEGFYYAHIKQGLDKRPNEFQRVLLSRIGKTILFQKNGNLSKKKNLYTAKNFIVSNNKNLDIEYDKEVSYRIIKENVKFDIFCNIKKSSDTLIVFGQSALDQNRVNLPAFRRWSWSRELEHSCIILNDPTLYLNKELQAGWFLGDSSLYYTKAIAEIIKDIATTANISFDKILFTGASAGGFTSLTIASHIIGSSCIIDVPQTNLHNYIHKKEIEKLSNICNLDLNGDDYWKFSALGVFKKTGYIPNILYLKNSLDKTAGDVATQFLPFKNEIQDLHLRIKSKSIMLYKTYTRFHLIKGGHFPLSKEKTIENINIAIDIFHQNKSYNHFNNIESFMLEELSFSNSRSIDYGQENQSLQEY